MQGAIMRIAVILLMAITASAATAVATGLTDSKGGSREETPCREQNELFGFYFDEPEKKPGIILDTFTNDPAIG
jgi:hypothetical protein